MKFYKTILIFVAVLFNPMYVSSLKRSHNNMRSSNNFKTLYHNTINSHSKNKKVVSSHHGHANRHRHGHKSKMTKVFTEIKGKNGCPNKDDDTDPCVITKLQFVKNKSQEFSCQDYFQPSDFMAVPLLELNGLGAKNLDMNKPSFFWLLWEPEIFLCYEMFKLSKMPSGLTPINVFEIVRQQPECYTKGLTALKQGLNDCTNCLFLCVGYNPKLPLVTELFGADKELTKKINELQLKDAKMDITDKKLNEVVFTKNSKQFTPVVLPLRSRVLQTMKNIANFNSAATKANNSWTGNSSGQKKTTDIISKDIEEEKVKKLTGKTLDEMISKDVEEEKVKKLTGKTLDEIKNIYCLYPNVNEYFIFRITYHLCYVRALTSTKQIEILDTVFDFLHPSGKEDNSLKNFEEKFKFNTISMFNTVVDGLDSKIEVEEVVTHSNTNSNTQQRDINHKINFDAGFKFGGAESSVQTSFSFENSIGKVAKEVETKTDTISYSCSAAKNQSITCYNQKKISSQIVPYVTTKKITSWDGKVKKVKEEGEKNMIRSETMMKTDKIEAEECMAKFGYDNNTSLQPTKLEKEEITLGKLDKEVLTDIILVERKTDDHCPEGYRSDTDDKNGFREKILLCYKMELLSKINHKSEIVNAAYFDNKDDDNSTECLPDYRKGSLHAYSDEMKKKLFCLGNKENTRPYIQFTVQKESQKTGFYCEVFNYETKEKNSYYFCGKTDENLPKSVKISDFKITGFEVISRSLPTNVDVITVTNSSIDKKTLILTTSEEENSKIFKFGHTVGLNVSYESLAFFKLGISFTENNSSKDTNIVTQTNSRTVKQTCKSEKNKEVECRLLSVTEALSVNYSAKKEYTGYDGPIGTPEIIQGKILHSSDSILHITCCKKNCEKNDKKCDDINKCFDDIKKEKNNKENTKFLELKKQYSFNDVSDRRSSTEEFIRQNDLPIKKSKSRNNINSNNNINAQKRISTESSFPSRMRRRRRSSIA